MRREDQDGIAVSGSGRLGPREKSTPQRPLPDAWRALYRPKDRGGTAEGGGGDGGQESAEESHVHQLGGNAKIPQVLRGRVMGCWAPCRISRRAAKGDSAARLSCSGDQGSRGQVRLTRVS